MLRVSGFLATRRLLRVFVHLGHGLWVARFRLRQASEAQRLAAVQGWSAALLRHLGVRLQAHGGVLDGAVLVVANHVSWLDIATLHAVEPRIRFVSKAAVGRWPLIGHLARTARALFIERERKRDALRVGQEIVAALTHGDAVGVFPEGTTGPGDPPLPFHANLLQAAISTAAPLQPIVLRYSQPAEPLSRAAQYIGETTLVGSLLRLAWARDVTVHLRVLEPVSTDGRERRELAADVRHRIAARLQADMALTPISQATAASAGPPFAAVEVKGASMTATTSASNTAYGVTKPVGQVLISFPTEADARAACDDMVAAGFGREAITFFTAEQMVARTADDIQNAGILASIGQELNLVKAQHELAVAGHPFVSVAAKDDEQAQRAADIARAHGAERAQRYGRLIIEELIPPGTGERQVAESPDRGLDAQTRSGEESN